MLAVITMSAYAAADEARTITNPLGMNFPWDMVSMDFPAGTFKGDTKVTVAGEDRPVQVEQVEVDGKTIDRAWFFATLGGKEKSVDVTFAPGKADVMTLPCGRRWRRALAQETYAVVGCRGSVNRTASIQQSGSRMMRVPKKPSTLNMSWTSG